MLLVLYLGLLHWLGSLLLSLYLHEPILVDKAEEMKDFLLLLLLLSETLNHVLFVLSLSFAVEGFC